MCVIIDVVIDRIRIESARVRGSNKDGRDVFLDVSWRWVAFSCWDWVGQVTHQMGTVNEKVCESDFVPLWDGTIMRRSLAEPPLSSEILNLLPLNGLKKNACSTQHTTFLNSTWLGESLKNFPKYPDKEIKDIFCLNSHLGPLQFVALSL